MVEDFIYRYDGTQKDILLFLHELLEEEFGLEAKIKYKIPFYYRKSWICYLNPDKKKGVELCFTRGNELSNEQGILLTKGRKQVRSLEISSLSEIPERVLREIIHEALLLDENVPYKPKYFKS